MVYDSCIIEDFILPALLTKEFGFLLEWVDVKKLIFRVFWSHKSGRTWSEKYSLVFTTWDRLKGRKDQAEKDYFTDSKGRFRSALNRLKSKVTYLKSMSTKGYRYYQLSLPSDTINEQLAKQKPTPTLELPCSPPEFFESASNSEDQSGESEACNSPSSSSAAESFDFEDQGYRIETECFSDDDTRNLTVLKALDIENSLCENQEYDSFVPNMDLFQLDALNDCVCFDDIQKCAVSFMLEELDADICFDVENMEFQTIDPKDLKELFGV